jgi:hypothetical protein
VRHITKRNMKFGWCSLLYLTTPHTHYTALQRITTPLPLPIHILRHLASVYWPNASNFTYSYPERSSYLASRDGYGFGILKVELSNRHQTLIRIHLALGERLRTQSVWIAFRSFACSSQPQRVILLSRPRRRIQS